MANIYFGANLNPSGLSGNGNWGDVTQWFSDPGQTGKSPSYAIPLGRLPYVGDNVNIVQSVASNVGYWSGVYPAGSYVAGTWPTNIGNLVTDASLTTANIFSGTISSGYLYGGKFTGTVTATLGNCLVTGTLTGSIGVQGNPTVTGSIVNITGFRMDSGTWTYPLTSWATPYANNFMVLNGGTFNPSSLSNNFATLQTQNITILPTNIFAGSVLTSVYLNTGTDLSAFSNSTTITLGSLTQGCNFNIFGGSTLPWTIYQKTNGAGTTVIGMNSGTFTGLLTVIPTTVSTSPVRVVWGTGTIYNPTTTVPLVNKTGYTGKGITSVPPSYGAPSYNPNIYISGSSDILQSELA